MIHVVHDPDGNRIAEYDYDSATGSSTLIREYIWMAGRPVAVVEGGQIYFIRTDHIGRPVFATNFAGVKVWSATYLPFGGVRESGIGAAHGRTSFETFSHKKSVAYQARLNGIPLFHPPFGRLVNALLAYFIGTE